MIETTLEVSLQLTDSERMVDDETHDANFVPPSLALGFRKRVQPVLDGTGGRGRDGGQTLRTRILRSLHSVFCIVFRWALCSRDSSENAVTLAGCITSESQ
jgi:hypothetical protein